MQKSSAESKADAEVTGMATSDDGSTSNLVESSEVKKER